MNTINIDTRVGELMAAVQRDEISAAQAIRDVDRVLRTLKRVRLSDQEAAYNLKALLGIGESYEALSSFDRALARSTRRPLNSLASSTRGRLKPHFCARPVAVSPSATDGPMAWPPFEGVAQFMTNCKTRRVVPVARSVRALWTTSAGTTMPCLIRIKMPWRLASAFRIAESWRMQQ